MTEHKPWRELFKVHPAADMWPMMDDDELRALAANIDEYGLLEGPVFYCDRPQGDLNRKEVRAIERLESDLIVLLDGRNRLEAVERFSKKWTLTGDGNSVVYRNGGGSPGEAVILYPYSCDDPYAYTASRNAHRRHLTTEKKRAILAELLKANPERSNLATAKMVGASDKTAGAVRAELERRSEIPNVVSRLDTAGRSQPAAKPARTEVVNLSTVPAPHRDFMATGILPGKFKTTITEQPAFIAGADGIPKPTMFDTPKKLRGSLYDLNTAGPQAEPVTSIGPTAAKLERAFTQISHGLTHVADATERGDFDIPESLADALIKLAKTHRDTLKEFIDSLERARGKP